MNPDEALRLCRMAKSISPAQAVDEFTPAAWALVLRDVRLADAEDALAQLGGEQEWVHVSHIVKRVNRIRSKRVSDFGPLPDPPKGLDPDDTAAHIRWLDTTTEAIADGTYQRPAPDAIEHKRDVVRELGQAGASVNAALATRPLREAHAAAMRELQAAAAEKRRARDERQAELEAMRKADRDARMTTTPAVDTTRDTKATNHTEETS